MRKCLKCSHELQRKEKESVRDFNKRVYCSMQCSNSNQPRRKPGKNSCKLCGSEFERCRTNNGSWGRKTICEDCSLLDRVESKTKSDIFSDYANWQSARSTIAKNARKIYERSGKPKECLICGYDKHYEVCHIKAVSEFSEDAKIGEVNSVDNLIALCPNHHWEYDSGLLDIGNEHV